MTLKNTLLWTAIVTPFHPDGSIDWASLDRLVASQVAAGCGMVVGGSTGEGFSLSTTERLQLIEYVIGLKPTVPLVVSVPAATHADVLEFIRHCNGYPIVGYLAMTPLYTRPGIHGQTTWFQSLLDASAYPMILYNNKARAATMLPTETVEALQQHPRFFAIKDSNGNADVCLQYRALAPGIQVFSGDDDLLLDVLAAGGIGLISVLSNMWPHMVQQFLKRALASSLTQAHIQAWKEICAVLYIASNPIPIKGLLAHSGVISSATVRTPLSLLDDPKPARFAQICEMAESLSRLLQDESR
jgi:4-hydroxy-tetrahydrodipicolinate synthase